MICAAQEPLMARGSWDCHAAGGSALGHPPKWDNVTPSHLGPFPLLQYGILYPRLQAGPHELYWVPPQIFKLILCA